MSKSLASIEMAVEAFDEEIVAHTISERPNWEEKYPFIEELPPAVWIFYYVQYMKRRPNLIFRIIMAIGLGLGVSFVFDLVMRSLGQYLPQNEAGDTIAAGIFIAFTICCYFFLQHRRDRWLANQLWRFSSQREDSAGRGSGKPRPLGPDNPPRPSKHKPLGPENPPRPSQPFDVPPQDD